MIRHSGENLEFRLQVFTQGHDGSDIAASVAVVGCRPHGHHVLGGEMIFVAFVDELVRAGDEVEVVYVVELLNHT